MGYGLQWGYVATKLNWGQTAERATANLPQTTTGNLFTITGGRILLTAIVGEVTTVIQTQLNNTKVVFDPTVTGANVDLCANLDITADAVGTLYSITGTATDAMASGLGVASMATPWILQPGAIALTCSASNTGQVKWKIWYTTMDDGAVVAAA